MFEKRQHAHLLGNAHFFVGPGTSIWGVLGCWLLGAKCVQWAMVRSWLKLWANLANGNPLNCAPKPSWDEAIFGNGAGLRQNGHGR